MKTRQARNPDLNTKLQTKTWFEFQPDAYRHFSLARKVLLSHYSGDNHGYINMAQRPEYRFNKAGDGYVAITGSIKYSTVRFYGFPKKNVLKRFVGSHWVSGNIVEFKIEDEESTIVLDEFLSDPFHEIKYFNQNKNIIIDCDELLGIEGVLKNNKIDEEILNEVLREVWCRTHAHTKFRKELLARWNNKCALTGIKTQELLVASHIKPWAKSQEKEDERWEQTCVDNGLILVSPIDKLFDLGFLAFDDNGAVLFHDDDWSERYLSDDVLGAFGLRRDDKRKIGGGTSKLNQRLKNFLAYHRKEVFNFYD